jgi:outer membrane usher protein FimD/PapC
MTAEALSVAVSLYALAVSVAYFLRDRAALRMEDEFCDALASANGRCDKLAADLADATARLNQANQALALAEGEIALVTAERNALRTKEAPEP